MGRRLLVALTGALVLAVAVLAHARSLGARFVYDDHRFVEQNPAIATLEHPGRFFTDPRTASAEAGIEPDVYRPLRTLHFAVDRALFGLAPFGWHLGNVLLHALNAALVWVLLLRVLAPRAPGPAGVLAATGGALLFAAHPVASEAVAWVSSRGDLLALLLVLLAFEVMRRPGVLRTAGGAALVLLACLAKESAVVAFAWLPLRDRALPAAARPPARTTWARAALLLAVAVGYLAIRHAAMAAAGGRPFAQVDVPPEGRAAVARTMLAGVAWYAKALLWPTGFRLEDDVLLAGSLGDPAVVLGAGLLATMLLAGGRALVRGDAPLALACLGPLVALAPVSNVIVPLKAFVAERFLYPALPFLALLAALGALSLVRFVARRRDRLPSRLVPAGAAAVVLALGALAYAREGSWRDDRALWEAVRRHDPSNPRSYEGLGFEWFRTAEERARAGDLAGAEEAFRVAERHYRTYLESAPEDGKSVALLGDLFGRVARELEVRAGPVTPTDEEASALRDALPTDVDPGSVTTTVSATGAGYARFRQIEAYQRALAIWDRVGLGRGRGWPALYRRTAERLRAVAIKVGALGSARLANEVLLRDDARSGTGPRHAQRRARAWLAALAVWEKPPSARPLSPEQAARRDRLRGLLVRDVGLDPNRSDAELRVALVPTVSDLLAEQGDDPDLRRFRAAYLLVRSGNRSDGAAIADLRLAAEDLRWIATHLPDDPGTPYAVERLRQVEARLGERR